MVKGAPRLPNPVVIRRIKEDLCSQLFVFSISGWNQNPGSDLPDVIPLSPGDGSPIISVCRQVPRQGGVAKSGRLVVRRRTGFSNASLLDKHIRLSWTHSKLGRLPRYRYVCTVFQQTNLQPTNFLLEHCKSNNDGVDVRECIFL